MRASIRPRSPLGATLALLATVLSPDAGVLVVDAAGGVPYTGIQDAVDAAQEGDTILVRDGSYGRFRIEGKSLDVVADGDDVRVQVSFLGYTLSSAEVHDLAPGQEVVLRGLELNPGFGVFDCEGAVWIDDVRVSGTTFCSAAGIPGALVSNSSRVTLTRCALKGESPIDFQFLHAASAGLEAVSSTVQAFDCVIDGSDGQGPVFGYGPSSGGPGLSIDRSTVTLSGCTITGGPGGTVGSLGGPLCDPTAHAVGGPGVLFVGGTGTVQAVDSTAYGGAQSLEPFCPGLYGPAGPAITGGGTVVVLPGFSRHLEATSPVRGGEALTFDVGGQPGEVPVVLTSLAHEPVPFLAFSGVLVVGLPVADVFVLGPLPANGSAALSFPAPHLGIEAQGFYAQAVFLDAAGRLWIGAGATTVLLGAGI